MVWRRNKMLRLYISLSQENDKSQNSIGQGAQRMEYLNSFIGCRAAALVAKSKRRKKWKYPI
jgi:hypothetical protein